MIYISILPEQEIICTRYKSCFLHANDPHLEHPKSIQKEVQTFKKKFP